MNKPLSLTVLTGLLVACGSSPPQEGVAQSSASELQICAKGPTVTGVDVSYYQGNIDFAQVKASGRGFAIARVSDGSFQDPKFGTYYADIKAAGMVRGSYQFFRAGQDPIAQADALLQKIGALGVGDLPPVLDVEVSDGQSGGTVANGVVAWVNHVAAKIGRKPLIYTAGYFWGSIGAPAVNADLWVANWQVNCPNMPSGFGGWLFWQSADNASVPGIGGAVDGDVWNGSLQDLQNYARPPDIAPRGNVDVIDCAHVAGWAQDEDTPQQAIAAHVYFGGAAGDPKAQGIPLTAGNHRADLCGPLGSCDHAFDLATPLSLQDGAPHAVHVYAIDSSGNGDNPEIGSGQINCATPKPPVDAAHGLKRWVTSPTDFNAWKLSALADVAHEPDPVIAAYPKGPDFPATPVVVQADDGTPEVWVVDGAVRRHVIDPASLAAWRFSVTRWPAAKVNALVAGLDWRATPFFVQGSGPEVYFLDEAAPSTPKPPAADAGAPMNDGGTASPSAADASDSGTGGGCTVHGNGDSAISGTWWLAVALLMSARRRWKAAE